MQMNSPTSNSKQSLRINPFRPVTLTPATGRQSTCGQNPSSMRELVKICLAYYWPFYNNLFIYLLFIIV